MPGKETYINDPTSNGSTETFLFTSESVGEGHPGIILFIYFLTSTAIFSIKLFIHNYLKKKVKLHSRHVFVYM